MSRRGTVRRRCQVCATYAEKVERTTRWTCPNNPDHAVRWSAIVDIGPRGGPRKQSRRSFDTKEEALAWLNEVQVEAAKGERVEASKLTVAEYLTGWMRGLELSDLEEATLVWYRSAVERHIIPELGGHRLQALTATTIETFLADKAANGRLDRKGGLGPTSIRRLVVTLHKSLDAAVRKRLIHTNPVDLADKPAVEVKHDVTESVWTPEQMDEFLEATSGDRLHPLWHTVCWTGLRREEVAALKWTDIDLDAGILSVRRARVLVGAKIIEKGPKSKASRRTVELDDDTVGVLRAWRKAQLEERLSAGGAWNEGGWVFCDEAGRPWRPDSITYRFVKAAKAAGLPPTDIRGLRHAHGTAMLKAGAHPKVVQERLGHASIKVTMDIYSSVLPSMQRDAVTKLAEMMRGGSS